MVDPVLAGESKSQELIGLEDRGSEENGANKEQLSQKQ